MKANPAVYWSLPRRQDEAFGLEKLQKLWQWSAQKRPLLVPLSARSARPLRLEELGRWDGKKLTWTSSFASSFLAGILARRAILLFKGLPEMHIGT